MFKSPVGEFAMVDSLPLKPEYIAAYKIGVEDKLTFSLYTNNGSKLIEGISTITDSSSGGGGVKSPEFLVLKDSTVDLPVMGRIKLAGLTVEEAELVLEKAFAKNYQDPYIQLTVTNKRVIVFPGTGSSARVVELANNNTTLMEVIAQAGGISPRGKAKRIKLIRKEGDIRKIYVIDLSTIEGLKYADIVLQANDYIYVEPKTEFIRGLGQEVGPILSLFSTFLVVFSLFLSN